MRKHFFLFITLAFTVEFLNAQVISEESFSTILNNKPIIYYDKINKKYYGCGMNLDCMGLPMSFTNIVLHKQQRRLKISGYVNPTTSKKNRDTIGTNNFKIFVAKPVKSRLTNIRILAEVFDTIRTVSNRSMVDTAKFSFSVDFAFSKDDCLYIESGELFRLKEYKIGSLVK
jgi:hypothetical protein